MNHVLQVVRGRSVTTTLKLADGVTSLGRHDDCLIRIKSSQVSRRHCEIFEVGGKLTVRDLGSSNGTFVNGKRISGQQVLKSGDELTVGAVTLRVVALASSATPTPTPTAGPASRPGDTAVVEAIPIIAESDDEEFEIDFDEEATADLDVIPLADQDTAVPTPKPPAAKKTTAPKATPGEASPKTSAKPKEEEEAVAQFLLDLNLDEE